VDIHGLGLRLQFPLTQNLRPIYRVQKYLYNGIIQPHTTEGRQDMLHGGDPRAVYTDSGGQLGIEDVMDIRLDEVIIRYILANENDAFIHTGRFDLHINLPACMQSDAGATYFFFSRSL